jgi:hydrogenase expression/formation protein HypE
VKIGKLSHEELKKLVLDRLPEQPGTVLYGPGIGLDCASVRFSDGQVVVTSDPITGTNSGIGSLSVHVSCNDIAACGIRPSFLMMVLIVPPDGSEDDLKRIVDEASGAARKLNVTIIGGHTEVSDAVNRFVIVTTAIGFTYGDSLISAGNGRPGDTILMTKTAGIEGTAIMSLDQADRLSDVLTISEQAEARALVHQVSVIEEGTCGGRFNVHAMHDATEGGILGACWELAEASGLGCVIDQQAIPVLPVTRKICLALDLDPLRLISSGSMLIATDQPDSLIDKLREKDILCTVIGRLVEEKKRIIKTPTGIEELEEPGPDELYKIK